MESGKMSNAMIFTGIDHPAVAASDPVALADWYCENLGYKLNFKNEKNVCIIEAPDGSFIEIMPKDDTTRPERTTWTPGWSHLALRVDDFDAACRYIKSRGIVFSAPEANAIGGGKVRNFNDPEGNMLQLVWRS